MVELEQERAKLFEVFKAGYQARARIAGSGRSFHTPEDLNEAFDAWLQEQVDEVDVLWQDSEASKALASGRAVLDEVDMAPAAYFETALSETRAPEDVFGPFDPQEFSLTGNDDKFDEVVNRLPLANLRVLLAQIDAATGVTQWARKPERVTKIRARIATLEAAEEAAEKERDARMRDA